MMDLFYLIVIRLIPGFPIGLISDPANIWDALYGLFISDLLSSYTLLTVAEYLLI